MDFTKELEAAKGVATEAGRAILEIYEQNNYQVELKPDESPLTTADRVSNDLIVAKLKQQFPEYAILSEEEQDDLTRLGNECCFVIDPLDGTKEFVKRNGQFTVNIALAYRHESVMGVIYVPVTKELYYAAKGIGAFLMDADGGVKQLHVTDCTDLKKVRVVTSSSHGCEQMDGLIKKYQFNHLVKVGSSIKGCMIARGDAEIYYRYNPTKEWDTAAMQCIVEEAGGIFMQMDDTPMYYNRENTVNDKGFYIINRKENRI